MKTTIEMTLFASKQDIDDAKDLISSKLRVVEGYTKTMIQVHFPTDKQAEAQAFVEWLHSKPTLQEKGIEKARVTETTCTIGDREEKILIVRLSLAQANVLKMGPDAGTQHGQLFVAPRTKTDNAKADNTKTDNTKTDDTKTVNSNQKTCFMQ